MNRMLALLPDDYKLDFILRGLFLWCLLIDVRSHLHGERVSDPRALALKADELYQIRVSSSVNFSHRFLRILSRWTQLPPFLTPPSLLYPKDLPPQLQPLRDQVGFIRNMARRLSTAGSLAWSRKLVVRQVEDPVQSTSPVPDPVPAPAPPPIPEEVCCSSLHFLQDILYDREFLVDS